MSQDSFRGYSRDNAHCFSIKQATPMYTGNTNQRSMNWIFIFGHLNHRYILTIHQGYFQRLHAPMHIRSTVQLFGCRFFHLVFQPFGERLWLSIYSSNIQTLFYPKAGICLLSLVAKIKAQCSILKKIWAW